MAKTISFDIKLSVDGKEQVVKVGADVKQLAREVENARASSRRFRDGLADFANFTMGLTNVQNALSSISGAMNSLTAESCSFAGAMRQANTMAGEGAAGFELMKEQVTELSKHIPIARDELARGLYQVISNGVPKDNWISYLEASAKSAVGGIAKYMWAPIVNKGSRG